MVHWFYQNKNIIKNANEALLQKKEEGILFKTKLNIFKEKWNVYDFIWNIQRIQNGGGRRRIELKKFFLFYTIQFFNFILGYIIKSIFC